MPDDGYAFELETDSLANAMGKEIPARSLVLVTGGVGDGKSLITQRLAYGLVENGTSLAMVTTELTTRGWLEQTDSLGYGLTAAADADRFLLLSRFGVLSEEREAPVPIDEVLASPGVAAADVAVIDRASPLLAATEGSPAQVLSALRRHCSAGHTLILTVDPGEVDPALLRELRGAAEVVIDMRVTEVGGFKRTIAVTRFLRAAGPVQARIGWRVEPGMGFIVDITAVS